MVAKTAATSSIVFLLNVFIFCLFVLSLTVISMYFIVKYFVFVFLFFCVVIALQVILFVDSLLYHMLGNNFFYVVSSQD